MKDNDKTLSSQHKKPLHNLIADTQTGSQKNIKQVNRRQFLHGSAMGVAGLALAGCGDTDNGGGSGGDGSNVNAEFFHGVASGDPLADSVILWTRATPETRVYKLPVFWEIATDKEMQNIVDSGKSYATSQKDYTVKVDVTGLEPNTVYYYQFRAKETISKVGRTKTLPVGSVDQVKLAVFSCANYPAGYFHAYADAAKRDDVDVALHLGDYIYEYARYLEDEEGKQVTDENGNLKPAYASANAEKLGRVVNPENEIVSVQDYRLRYAQYKTDKDLQALHAAMPMIAVWDDHEISNDTYKDGADNHQEKDGRWDERKIAAMTAYHEWLPTRNENIQEIYRSFDFGDLLSLHMLDTRVVARDKQLDYNDYLTKDDAGKVVLDAPKFDAALKDSSRQLLGLKQHNWLTMQMQASQAKWQVLGQQVLMGKLQISAPLILNLRQDSSIGVGVTTYLNLRNKAKLAPLLLTPEDKAILAQPAIPYNLDSWDGYDVARENLYGMVKSLNKNLVVLAGDTHNAWASNLVDNAGDAVGVEFATSSVSSPGFEEYLPNVPPFIMSSVFPTLVEAGTLKFLDSSRRGYMLITITPERCKSDWVFVSDILRTSYFANIGKTMTVSADKNVLN